MFGHAWRTSIHKFYATSNRRLARMLGYKQAFPHTEIPEQPTPATLSIAQVNDVVDKLDMPIVQSLFDAVQKPARPKTYLHHLITHAIRRRMKSLLPMRKNTRTFTPSIWKDAGILTMCAIYLRHAIARTQHCAMGMTTTRTPSSYRLKRIFWMRTQTAPCVFIP